MNKLLCCLFAAVLLGGCSRSNNLLLGRIENTVGSHSVVVTDCYRTSVDPPRVMGQTSDGKLIYQFKPCKDADVWIRGEELSVNGTSYGKIKPRDGVLVDHGVVSVQRGGS